MSEGKIVLNQPEPGPSEWAVHQLQILVDAGIVRVVLRSDSGQERTYRFDAGTTPSGVQAMRAINRHNGSAKLLNVWILERLQEADPRLAGEAGV